MPTADSDIGAQDGNVWEGWFAHIDEEHITDYKRFLGKVYRHQLDAWVQAGLIVSYKLLTSMARSPDDWNLAILLEHKNYSEMDVPDDVWAQVEDEALARIRTPELEPLIANKNSWRRVIGSRMFREIAWA